MASWEGSGCSVEVAEILYTPKLYHKQYQNQE